MTVPTSGPGPLRVTGSPTPPAKKPLHLVLMGVSGTSKSSLGRVLHRRLGWEMAEGDAFHPPANIAKMAGGTPLTDEDRWPWLEALARWTAEHDAGGEPTLMSCSALRRAYRDVLRTGGAGTFFVHLVGERALLLERLEHRQGHYFTAGLLDSQLATLEPLQPDERGMVLDVAEPVESLADQVMTALGLTG